MIEAREQMGVLKKAHKAAARRAGAQVAHARKRALLLIGMFLAAVAAAWVLQLLEIGVPGMAWYVYS
ncbi:hypothetical protein [Palleronia sp.]|uniref:hypothetical protein n=1 Tax=Palleronia sp. TaxID=1940284 RepID=UPI0035C7D1B8